MPANTATRADVDRIETELLLLARWLEAVARRKRYPMDRAAYLLLRRLDGQGPQSVTALAAGWGSTAPRSPGSWPSSTRPGTSADARIPPMRA
jgi:hypothetical protein